MATLARTDGWTEGGSAARRRVSWLPSRNTSFTHFPSPSLRRTGREEDEGRPPVGSQSGSSPNSIFAAHSARREGGRAAFLADRQTRRSFNFTDYNPLTCWPGMQKQLELFKG